MHTGKKLSLTSCDCLFSHLKNSEVKRVIHKQLTNLNIFDRSQKWGGLSLFPSIMVISVFVLWSSITASLASRSEVQLWNSFFPKHSESLLPNTRVRRFHMAEWKSKILETYAGTSSSFPSWQDGTGPQIHKVQLFNNTSGQEANKASEIFLR